MKTKKLVHRYEDCIVTYLDILGFRNLIKNSSVDELRNILKVFRRTAKPYGAQVHMEIVSDAVIRATTISRKHRDGAFFRELIDLLHIQIESIANGIVVRGALTIGELHIGKKLKGPLFGPALVRAYTMESNEVIFPRIAVDEKAIEILEGDMSLWTDGEIQEEERDLLRNMLRTDDSGLKYIDYLNSNFLISELDSGYPGYTQLLRRHKTLINKGLKSSCEPRIRRKYVWLKNYHNSHIEKELNTLDLTVFNEEFESNMSDVLKPLRVT